MGTQYTEQRTLDSGANLKGQVLGSSRRHGQNGRNHLYTIHLASLVYQLLGSTLDSLSLETFNLFLHRIVLLNILADNALQVLGIVKESLHGTQHVLCLIQQLLALLTSFGLDTTDAGSNATFRDNLEESDATCRCGVDTTTKLTRRTKAHHTNLIAVFLAKQGNGTQLLGFFHRHVAMFVAWQVLTNHVIDHTFHLTNLLVSNLLKVREVETQCVRTYKRTFLLHMVA